MADIKTIRKYGKIFKSILKDSIKGTLESGIELGDGRAVFVEKYRNKRYAVLIDFKKMMSGDVKLKARVEIK